MPKYCRNAPSGLLARTNSPLPVRLPNLPQNRHFLRVAADERLVVAGHNLAVAGDDNPCRSFPGCTPKASARWTAETNRDIPPAFGNTPRQRPAHPAARRRPDRPCSRPRRQSAWRSAFRDKVPRPAARGNPDIRQAAGALRPSRDNPTERAPSHPSQPARRHIPSAHTPKAARALRRPPPSDGRSGRRSPSRASGFGLAGQLDAVIAVALLPDVLERSPPSAAARRPCPNGPPSETMAPSSASASRISM